MYSLIGRQKWWVQVLLTIGFIILIITTYLLARSWGYDKARAKFQAEDTVKAQAEAQKIARAEFLEKRVAELEPKLLAYEKLDDEKKKLDGTISDKIDAVIAEGQKDAQNIDAASNCWARANDTCARFARLKPPIAIDCEAYKQRLCANANAGSATPCPSPR